MSVVQPGTVGMEPHPQLPPVWQIPTLSFGKFLQHVNQNQENQKKQKK